MTIKAERADSPDTEPPEASTPHHSMLRLTAPHAYESDPRAAYSRALVNMVRVGDIAHLLAPAEILEAFCEAVAEPLDLAVAVVIDAPDGLPRSMPWKSDRTDWRAVEHGERRAWSNFAELLAPELLTILPPDSAGPRQGRILHWSVQPLAVPLLGILQCGTLRALGGADHGLLKCMSVRLSTALGRRRVDDAASNAEEPSATSGVAPVAADARRRLGSDRRGP